MPVLSPDEHRPAAGGPGSLTPRELTVVRGVVAGLSNRAIGARLHVEHRTVQSHVASAMRKFDATTRTGLAVAVLRHSVVPLDDDAEWWV